MVLDLMMGGLSGFEVCRIVRRETQVPILILSARGGEADKAMAIKLGADDYVTKPFGMRDLIERVRALLSR
jgi:DNA-binding response OmpR family regulator